MNTYGKYGIYIYSESLLVITGTYVAMYQGVAEFDHKYPKNSDSKKCELMLSMLGKNIRWGFEFNPENRGLTFHANCLLRK